MAFSAAAIGKAEWTSSAQPARKPAEPAMMLGRTLPDTGRADMSKIGHSIAKPGQDWPRLLVSFGSFAHACRR